MSNILNNDSSLRIYCRNVGIMYPSSCMNTNNINLSSRQNSLCCDIAILWTGPQRHFTGIIQDIPYRGSPFVLSILDKSIVTSLFRPGIFLQVKLQLAWGSQSIRDNSALELHKNVTPLVISRNGKPYVWKPAVISKCVPLKIENFVGEVFFSISPLQKSADFATPN